MAARSEGRYSVHDQTYEDKLGFFSKYHLTTYAFLNATEKTSSAHAIIDFKAEKISASGSPAMASRH